MRKHITGLLALVFATNANAGEISASVKLDYDEYLAGLWDHFHQNPELSTVEFKTAERMAKELRDAGFVVIEGIGGTGVVAILENGEGPMAMMRADMDGLPLEENSGLPNESTARQIHPETGEEMPVMHACGHDVHITSLVGTARQMAARKAQWNGTLMLVVQPAEEIGTGARSMREDGIWDKFGEPNFAFAFHVGTGNPAGKIKVSEGPKYAGSAAVDIIVHGVPGHGASPHHAKDPVLIGSQIVVALQTLVSRELAPRASGVVSVGSFHAGEARNIISDKAVLKLTVRFLDNASRDLLLSGVERVAVNVARAAGMPEDKLPEVIVLDRTNPPTYNDPALARRLKVAWADALGEEAVFVQPATGMGAEDYPHLIENTDITSVYWSIGGTPQDFLDAAKAGGPRAPGHHSPVFWIEPELSVRGGVESTVVALLEVLGK